jgi:hypothetical protein
VEKENTFSLPSVMLGRELKRLFHFCVKTAQLRIFEAPVYVSTQEIYARSVCDRLSGFRIDDLLRESRALMYLTQSWVGVKKQFRMRGWYYATKSEKKLLEQCLIRGFNLSLLPTEVGWPVAGNALKKHLFVWQSYVLLTLMKHFNVGDVFTLAQLFRLLNTEYQVALCDGERKQVSGYLKWLVMFGIIKKQQAYFEYVKLPEINRNMEVQLSQDKKFVQIVAKL